MTQLRLSYKAIENFKKSRILCVVNKSLLLAIMICPAFNSSNGDSIPSICQGVRFLLLHIIGNSSCFTAILSQYSQLTTFNCDDNELTRITSRTFSGNPQLKELILSRNRIRFLDDDAFEGL